MGLSLHHSKRAWREGNILKICCCDYYHHHHHHYYYYSFIWAYSYRLTDECVQNFNFICTRSHNIILSWELEMNNSFLCRVLEDETQRMWLFLSAQIWGIMKTGISVFSSIYHTWIALYGTFYCFHFSLSIVIAVAIMKSSLKYVKVLKIWHPSLNIKAKSCWLLEGFIVDTVAME